MDFETLALSKQYTDQKIKEIQLSGGENIIPTETVLAEGVVASGATSWSRNDTGVTIAVMNQHKRIRLAIKGTSNVKNYWTFQFTDKHVGDITRIGNDSGMVITFQKISNGYFRIESIELNGYTEAILKGMIVKSESWLSGRSGNTTNYILDLTSFDENSTLKIAPVNDTTIDYSWCVCGYNC